MDTTFKKLFYAGIGLATEASDKFEKKVDELAKKGETSDSEVKKLVDELIKKTDEGTAMAEKQFNQFFEKFGYAKNSEITELRKKLESLEALATEKSKTAPVAKTTK